jgi:hypothetical protein
MLLIIQHLKSYSISFGSVIAQLDWAIQSMNWIPVFTGNPGLGACPVLDTGVNPPKAEDNDKLGTRFDMVL